MRPPYATFIILHSDVEADVAVLARAHAAFDPEHRGVIRVGRYPNAPEWAVALTTRADGSTCTVLTRPQATAAAWVEDSFVRASRRDG